MKKTPAECRRPRPNMTSYYNEHDAYPAQWLRNLIAAGHIAPGDVDERSIEDVRPDDLVGYTQCHFFAGVGVWSHALRQAGIPDDAPIWTGSCPCQPFSTAGEGAGFADERHLWPAFFHLIEQRGPAIVIGEQVASSDADPWVDLVCADMERLGYAFGATPFPSASVGAPHIRDRLYWVAGRVAHTGCARSPEQLGRWLKPTGLAASMLAGGVADLHSQRRGKTRERELSTGRAERAERDRNSGGMGNTDCEQHDRAGIKWAGRRIEHPVDGTTGGMGDALGDRWPGPVNGFWRASDWLHCRDGFWRPVEPTTFPLAHGAPSRVGRLRAYGNAINAEAARVFIEAVMECAP